MNQIIKIFTIILCLILSGVIYAQGNELYPFDSPQKYQQYQVLTKELRCLVCQNEDLADSQAPLAKDLRDQVYKMVKSGESSQEIKSYLRDRYGDFILFKPLLMSKTYVLWFGPFLLLLFGFVMLFLFVKKKKAINPKPTLTAEETKRVASLLED